MKKFSDFLENRCWPGYKPKPGKQPYSPGSCMKEASAAAIAAATAISKKKSGNYDSEGMRKTPYKNPDSPNRKSNAERRAELKEDLRKWFSKTDPAGGWKRINSKGEAIGPCAREPGEPKPKCMSNEKRASLSKKERASAVRAKRKNDPNPERQGKPINVSNFGKGKISEDMENLDEKNVPTSPEKWAQAKAQAKAKFDVYPSAYANGWASKKYKAMGGGWKSVSEENEVTEGAVPAQEKIITVKHKTSGKTLRISAAAAPKYRMMGYHYHPVNEAKDEQEYGYEGDMALNQLATLTRCADMIKELLKPDTDMPEWVQSKITLATDYIQTAADYMYSEMKESVEQIDELSNDTLKSYLQNRKDQEGTGLGRQGAGAKHQYSYENSHNGKRNAINRLDARQGKVGKYGVVPKVPGYNKEEVEQIDEITQADIDKSAEKEVAHAKKHGWKVEKQTYGRTYKHPKHGHIDMNRYGEWQHRPQSGIMRGKGNLIAHGNFEDLDKHISSLKEEVWKISEEQHKEISVHTEVEDGSHQDKSDTKDLHDRVKVAAKKHGATVTYQDRPSLRGSHTISARGSHEFHKEVKHIASDYEHLGAQHEIDESVKQIFELSDNLVANYLKKVNDKLIKKVGMKPDLYNHLEPKRQKGATRALNRLMKPVEEGTSADSDGGPPTPAAATLTVTGQPKLTKTVGETKLTPMVHEGAMKRMATDKAEDKHLGSWKVETPWKKITGTGTVTDKSGAKHTPMSRARDLARQAFKRKMEEQSNIQPNPFTVPAIDIGKAPKKPKEASPVAPTAMAESRQLEIVREAMKFSKKKKEEKVTEAGTDKFIADPELTSQITKSNP